MMPLVNENEEGAKQCGRLKCIIAAAPIRTLNIYNPNEMKYYLRQQIDSEKMRTLVFSSSIN